MPYRVKRHTVVQPLDPTIRLLPLTQNQDAIVDATDYDLLMQRNWRAQWDEDTQSFYAVSWPMRSMHRWLLSLEPGDKRQADHINHNTLDNRRVNLRIVTHAQNMMNRRKNKNSTSGFKGVSLNRNKWLARICINWKPIHLGYFTTPEAAHAAYCEAAKKLHGEFAKLN